MELGAGSGACHAAWSWEQNLSGSLELGAFGIPHISSSTLGLFHDVVTILIHEESCKATYRECIIRTDETTITIRCGSRVGGVHTPFLATDTQKMKPLVLLEVKQKLCWCHSQLPSSFHYWFSEETYPGSLWTTCPLFGTSNLSDGLVYVHNLPLLVIPRSAPIIKTKLVH